MSHRFLRRLIKIEKMCKQQKAFIFDHYNPINKGSNQLEHQKAWTKYLSEGGQADLEKIYFIGSRNPNCTGHWYYG